MLSVRTITSTDFRSTSKIVEIRFCGKLGNEGKYIELGFSAFCNFHQDENSRQYYILSLHNNSIFLTNQNMWYVF